MDIVYFGSDVFLPCFEYFAGRHRIRALYTYHNDEDYFTEYHISRRAAELGIPVHYEAASPETTREYFRDGCELYFVAEYDRLIEIPEDLPGFRGVNIHSSALPEGRSYYPIEAAMERGLTRTGVTMHELRPSLDGGDIISQRVFDITPEMDSVDVYLTCAGKALEMTEEVFADFDKAWDSAVKQKEKLPYWKRPAPEKLTVTHETDVSRAEDVFRRYNGMTQVCVDGRMYFVSSLTAGRVPIREPAIWLSENRLLFAVTDGHLRLNVLPMKEKEN